jgi:hypothetical protein
VAEGSLSGAALEEALAGLLYSGRSHPALPPLDEDEVAEAATTIRDMVLRRTHRGTGRVTDWFPQTIAAWRAHHEDPHLEQLVAAFCRSPACADWREQTRGISVEEAWFRFFDAEDIGDAAVREDEFLGAVMRGLAVTPTARFVWPLAVRRAPGGCYALTKNLVLHAALDGRYLRGPVTPPIAAVLNGDSVGDERLCAELRAMRLI